MGLSSLVAVVRGDRRGLGLGLKALLVCALGIPALLLTGLLLFGVCLLFGLYP